MSLWKLIMNKKLLIILTSIISIILLLASIFLGSTSIDFQDKVFLQIIYQIRLPRVLSVFLTGASLSLCGASMQGLLKNPMADGSTMGVSSAASLGAVVFLTFASEMNIFQYEGLMIFSILFAFLSLLLIIFLSYKIDSSLSTNTMILVGIIFSMFFTALITLCISFAGNKANTITFWTLGSLSSSDYKDVIIIFITFLLSAFMIFFRYKELNAFALGEENASHLGVNVKSVKIQLLLSVSILIGVCVSIGGSIAFVGLVAPHIARFIVGPNHKKLLPFSIITGANLLLFADLLARILIKPQELPLGVITSIIGSMFFIIIMVKQSRKE